MTDVTIHDHGTRITVAITGEGRIPTFPMIPIDAIDDVIRALQVYRATGKQWVTRDEIEKVED